MITQQHTPINCDIFKEEGLQWVQNWLLNTKPISEEYAGYRGLAMDVVNARGLYQTELDFWRDRFGPPNLHCKFNGGEVSVYILKCGTREYVCTITEDGHTINNGFLLRSTFISYIDIDFNKEETEDVWLFIGSLSADIAEYYKRPMKEENPPFFKYLRYLLFKY